MGEGEDEEVEERGWRWGCEEKTIFKCRLIEELRGIYFSLFPLKVIMPHWRFLFLFPQREDR